MLPAARPTLPAVLLRRQRPCLLGHLPVTYRSPALGIARQPRRRPCPAGSGVPNLGGVPDPRGAGLMGDTQGVTADGQQVAVHATDANPGAGNAHVYRVNGHQDGAIFGGYTVVVTGS